MSSPSDEDRLSRVFLSVLTAVSIVAAASGLMWCARRYIVELEAVAQGCLSGLHSWHCTLREWLVFGFTRNVFGIAAAVVGVFAVISRWRSFAVAAMCVGVAGAMLYRYELSGVGLLLGMLTWVRPTRRAARQT